MRQASLQTDRAGLRTWRIKDSGQLSLLLAANATTPAVEDQIGDGRARPPICARGGVAGIDAAERMAQRRLSRCGEPIVGLVQPGGARPRPGGGLPAGRSSRMGVLRQPSVG